jgi:hypothetical protein
MSIQCLSKQLDFELFGRRVDEVGQHVCDKTEYAFFSAGKVIKDVTALDYAFRAISESIKFFDLIAKIDLLTRPTLGFIATTRDFLDAARIFKTLHYVLGGKMEEDRDNRTWLRPITEVCLAIGRGITALQWLAAQKVIDLEEFAKKAKEVGGNVAFTCANALRGTTLMNIAFVGGLLGLIAQDAQGIHRGEVVISKGLSIASLASDVTSLSLGLFGFTNPFVLIPLSIVAGVAGVASFVADPANVSR